MLTKMTKARRISGKMKTQWTKELDETGFLICPMPGCSQRYVTLANFSTHYKWCSGEKDLKLCPYCNSVIFSENKATLHHMEVEHPDKVEEYKANYMVIYEPFESEAGTSNEVASIKTEGENSAMYIEEVSSKKSVKKPKRFYSKENHLSPKRKFFKHKMKHINAKVSENIKEFKKCVRFDSIVSKINSVSEVAKTAEILQEASAIKPPKKERKPRYILTGNTVEEQNFFEDDGQTDSATDINDISELPDSKLKLNTKSKLVLDLDRYKRYNEYLKWTRDWGSERKTYSRSKPSDKSLNSTFSTTLQGDIMEIQDIHQLDDKSFGSSCISLESEIVSPRSKISLDLSESDLNITSELTASVSDVSIFQRKTMSTIDSDLIPANAHTSLSKELISSEFVPHEEPEKEMSTFFFSRATNLLINEPVKNEPLGLKLTKIKVPIITYGKHVVPEKIAVNSKSISDFDSLIKKPGTGKRPYKRRKYNTSSSSHIPPQHSVDEMAMCVKNDDIKQPSGLPKRKRGRPSKMEMQQRESLLKSMSDAELRKHKETKSNETETKERKPVAKTSIKTKLEKIRKMCRFPLSGKSKFRSTIFKGTRRLSKFKGLNRIVYNARKISRQNMLKKRRSALFGNRVSIAEVEQDVSQKPSTDVQNLCHSETIPKSDHSYSAFGAGKDESSNLMVVDVQNATVSSSFGNKNVNTVSVTVHREMESPIPDQATLIPKAHSKITVSECNSVETPTVSDKAEVAGLNSQDSLILTSTPISQSKHLYTASASNMEKENCNEAVQLSKDLPEKVSLKECIEGISVINASPSKSVTGLVENSVRESFKFNKKLIYHPENINSAEPAQQVSKAVVEPRITFDELKRSCQDQSMSVSENFMSVDSIGAITEVITQEVKAHESHSYETKNSSSLSEKVKRPRGRPKKHESKKTAASPKETAPSPKETAPPQKETASPPKESASPKETAPLPKRRGRPKKQVLSEKSISETPESAHCDVQATVQNSENSVPDLSVNSTPAGLPITENQIGERKKRGRPKQHIENKMDTSGNVAQPDESSTHVLKLNESETNVSASDTPVLPRPRGQLTKHLADENTISKSSETEVVVEGDDIKSANSNFSAVDGSKISVSEKVEQSELNISANEDSNKLNDPTKLSVSLQSKSDVDISNASPSVAEKPRPDVENCSASENSAQIEVSSTVLNVTGKNENISSESPVLPKTRGRPKKHKKLATATAAGSKPLPVCSDSLPRSRGRPKKHGKENLTDSYEQTPNLASAGPPCPVSVRKSNRFKLKKVIADYSVYEKAENDTKAAENKPKTPPAKTGRRGRPKKDQSKDSESNFKNESSKMEVSCDSVPPVVDNAEVVENKPEAPPVKTGRRGRPRKNPLNDSEASVKNDSSKMEVSYDSVTPDVDNAESVLKKCSRKGRPQKCIDYANLNSGNLDVEIHTQDTVCDKTEKALKRSEMVSNGQESSQFEKTSSSHDDTFILPPKKRKRMSDSKGFRQNDTHALKDISETCSPDVKLLQDKTLGQSLFNKFTETVEDMRKPNLLRQLTRASHALTPTVYTELFPEYEPKKSMYMYLTASEYEKYLPPLKKSICFKIEKMSDAQEANWFELNPFESLPIGETNHFTFFTGGPVSSSAFCPTFGKSNQFIALSTNESLFHNQYYDCTNAEKGLIQIWNLGNLSGTRLQCQPSMELGICHNYGKVFEMAWCPNGAWQDSAKNENDLARLGLLAVAFSDSCIRIYSIPYPKDMERSEDKIPLYTFSPCVTLTPLSGGPGLITRKSPCTCLSWQKTNGCERIAGGYGSGMICVWLVSSSATIFTTNEEQKTFMPYLVFQGHGTPITSVSFSPLNGGRWLVSSSFDRTLKFFDLLDASLPFCTVKKGFARSAHWANNFCGAFASLHDDVMFKGSAFFKECGSEELSTLNITNPHSLLCISALSEVMNAYAVADMTGAVSVSVLKHLYQDHPKSPCYIAHDIFRTEVVTFKESPTISSVTDAEKTAVDIDAFIEFINSLPGDISDQTILYNSTQLLQVLDKLKTQNPDLEAYVLMVLHTDYIQHSERMETDNCLDKVVTIMDKHFALSEELLNKIASKVLKEVTSMTEETETGSTEKEKDPTDKESEQPISSLLTENETHSREEKTDTTEMETDSTERETSSTEKEIDSTEKEIDSTEKEIDSTEKEVDSTEKEIDSTEKKIDSTEKEIDSTEKETDSTHKEADSTEKETSSTETEIHSTEKETGSAQKETGSTQKETGSPQKETSSPQKETGATQKETGATQKETGLLSRDKSNLNEIETDSIPSHDPNLKEISHPSHETNASVQEVDSLPKSVSNLNETKTDFVSSSEPNANEKETDHLSISDANEKETHSLPIESNLNNKDYDSLPCESNLNDQVKDSLPCSESNVNETATDVLNLGSDVKDNKKPEVIDSHTGISNSPLNQTRENPLDSDVMECQDSPKTSTDSESTVNDLNCDSKNTKITTCHESSESGKTEGNAADSSFVMDDKGTAKDSLGSETSDETRIELLPCDSTSENSTKQDIEEMSQGIAKHSGAKDLGENLLPNLNFDEEESTKPADVESVCSEILEYECDGGSDVPDDFDGSIFSEDSMLSECSLESDCSEDSSLPPSPMPVNECIEDQPMDVTRDSTEREKTPEMSCETVSTNVCGTVEDFAMISPPTVKSCSISNEKFPVLEAQEPCETAIPSSPICSSLTIDSSNPSQSTSTLVSTTDSMLHRTVGDSQDSSDTSNKEQTLSQTKSSSLPSTSLSSTQCDSDSMEVSVGMNATPNTKESDTLSEVANNLQQDVCSNESRETKPETSENTQNVESGNAVKVESVSGSTETLQKSPVRKQPTKRAFLESLKLSRGINLFNTSKDKADEIDDSDMQGVKISCNNDQYEDLIAKHGLIYKDIYLCDSLSQQSSSKETTKSDLSADSYGISSINTVAWNPNHDSRFWLFTAGNAGIGRLSCLSDITTRGYPLRKKKM